jgi:hypothetical protein
MHDDKSGLGLRTLCFLFLEGKSTPHVWEREAITEGRKLDEWNESYISVRTGFRARTWVSKGTVVYICGLQREQSRTYEGCSGNNPIHPYKVYLGRSRSIHDDI